MNLIEQVHKQLKERKLLLATAESCTGGSLASKLTRIAGASEFYAGGVVAYSNDVKVELLGVDRQLIVKHGAVSAEVAYAMAKAVQVKLKSDIGLAVTGIAGPSGGTPEKPVGTVWCALAFRDMDVKVWLLQAHGSRAEIIEASCESLLEGLLVYVGDGS